ncbi:hypothetical protein IW140_005095 [Coemansia sp. RSA 1813]|nr:hypothetical protein EV178_005096 [Coemansia sp. RSA 1646]KAJ1768316.1 hypothetical protein LPJ74_004914 [Coemansia sp. RSA 1843]KAJ2089056.1 hypothetical protein IW138_003768 [Coemansia sp. RSA 986]KAJ2212018.1 hypothetical protein EV179_005004 [Coemansia sp. RSA 487]KAJ2566053.1 hypothetical protein IW140_005095 [Coemansia sp. RSA 1813]
MPKRWSQKHERILYNTVTTEYLESNKEIDWALVSSRVRTFNKDLCKARFYQLQRQLADRTSSKNAIWSRPEIEKLVAGAHMADMARLKSNDSKAHINWTTIANQFSNKRSPDECKRIYHNYRHLCKVSTGWEKYRPKVWLFCTTVALVFVVYVYGELVDILYYYIEGEESADL